MFSQTVSSFLKNDTFKHKRWRSEMVSKLSEKGLNDRRVLDAMGVVQRHLFLETMLDYMAYDDMALPISCGQTISQPSTVAFQTELLEIGPDMKVLEVGTGSGYQTAVLCAMGAKVFSVERQKELYDSAKRRLEVFFDANKPVLKQLRYRPKCFFGDGFRGLPEYGPFDRMIITCGAPYVPQSLLSQLKPSGIMVIPVGGDRQEMFRIVKSAEPPFEVFQQHYGDCKFVPMLGELNYN